MERNYGIMPKHLNAPLGPLMIPLAIALAVAGDTASAATLTDAPEVAVTNIHSFQPGDGVSPRAGLMLAPDGKLYGTTWRGGSGGGTTYRVDPETHAFQVLHVFSPLDANGRNADGYGSVSPLSIGSDGLLYGTTREGGRAGPRPTSRGAGVLFRFDPANPTEFTVLHHFATAAGDQDGATPSGAAVSDGHGNYYGATNIGVIYKWDGAAITPVHVFNSLNQDRTNFGGANPYGSPIFGVDGKLYGMTIYGGKNGRGTVYSLDPSSKEFKVLCDFPKYNFSGNSDNAPLQSLFLASDGALYGTNEFGGPNGTGLVFKVANGTVTMLHQFGPFGAQAQPRFSNADGSLPLSTLAEGADGMLYGTTYYGGASGAGTIFRIAKDGNGFQSLYSFGRDPSVGSHPATGLVRLSDGSMVGTTFIHGAGVQAVYRLTLQPFSVAIHPDPITAARIGRGTLTRTASAATSNGQPPYSYAWSVDSGVFVLHGRDTQNPSIFAALAACDEEEAKLAVTVTDGRGQSASASTAIAYKSTRPPGGVCD
jgi:uncharacterized repeat protein (TIGR03803 family)